MELKIVNGKIPKTEWVEFKKNLVDDNSNASEFIRNSVDKYNKQKRNLKNKKSCK